MPLVSAAAPASRRLIDPALVVESLATDATSAAALVDQASAEVAALLGFDPIYQSWTETLVGPIRAPRPLWLSARPVIEVTSVRPGDSTVTALDADTYVMDGAALHRIDGFNWESCKRGIAYTIAYRAGWWCYGSGDEAGRPADVPVLDGAVSGYVLTLCRAIARSSRRVGGSQRVSIRGASIDRAPGAFGASLSQLAPPPRGVLAWRSPMGGA